LLLLSWHDAAGLQVIPAGPVTPVNPDTGKPDRNPAFAARKLRHPARPPATASRGLPGTRQAATDRGHFSSLYA